MNVTAIDIAEVFLGTKETAGRLDTPMVLAMLKLDADWPEHDEVPWCSAYVNFIAWLLRLPRSRSLGARSWLKIGTPVPSLEDAKRGFDVVVLSRGSGIQPGPDTIAAPGHVGWFDQQDGMRVRILGGNQSNSVSYEWFPRHKILGIRRLHD